MSIEKAGSGVLPANVKEAAKDDKGRKSGKGYSSSSLAGNSSANSASAKKGAASGEKPGAKPRLSLKGSRSNDKADEAKPNTSQSGTDESPDMVYDQLMVLLQQALHEVPATLAAKEKRRR